jgi:hypothetical protein
MLWCLRQALKPKTTSGDALYHMYIAISGIGTAVNFKLSKKYVEKN